MLFELAKNSDGKGINPDDLPQEVKDFLDSISDKPDEDED